MQQAKHYFTFIFLFFVILSCSQSKESDPLRILFIGNSYTYYNSSPQVLKAMLQEKFPNRGVEVQLVSQGGMTLERHWQGDNALQVIKSGPWDYVILQEQSKLGMGVMIDNDMYFGETELFFEYARKFDAEIKKVGAKTVFFMTWALRDRPEEQEILTYAYATIAKELDAILAPVGLVWDKLRANEQLNLYAMDGSHPADHGSYLVASTIFATLLEDSPLGLSGKISGHKLSSMGAPSLEIQPLINIAMADAEVIQRASWTVVEAMNKSGDYLEVQEPKQSYTIPDLTKNENIDQKSIARRWYGTSTYSSSYLGLTLDVKNVNNILKASLSFYAPDRQDSMEVQDVKIEDNQLHLTIYDSLRRLSSRVRFSLEEGYITGISKSYRGHITQYKHWTLSRQNIQNEIDLAALDLMMQTFQAEIGTIGYVKAAVKHYKRYSVLIGRTYLPEEMYLNAVGYNLLQDKKLNDALSMFELAMTLYPKSVNTYDSYGEALVGSGQKEKALKIYTEGYELAKKTGDKNLSHIEANLKKLKENGHVGQEGRMPPLPPPPE